MKSLLWKTFGLTAPILLGLIGFSSPSEGLVGGGRVVARVCGDVGELTCASDKRGEKCDPNEQVGERRHRPHARR